jgi:hypothetical protein
MFKNPFFKVRGRNEWLITPQWGGKAPEADAWYMPDDHRPQERSGGFYYLPMWGIWWGMKISMKKRGYGLHLNP